MVLSVWIINNFDHFLDKLEINWLKLSDNTDKNFKILRDVNKCFIFDVKKSWRLDCRKVKNLLWRFVTKTKSKEFSLELYQVGEYFKKFNPKLRFINPAGQTNSWKRNRIYQFHEFFPIFFTLKSYFQKMQATTKINSKVC